MEVFTCKRLAMACCLIFLLKYASAQDAIATARRRDSLEKMLRVQKGTDKAFTMLRLADYWTRTESGTDSVALPYARSGYAIFKKAGNGFGMAWARFEEGTALMALGKRDQALSAFIAAKNIPISDTAKRKNELLATIWSNIAKVYSDRGQFDTSTKISMGKVLPYLRAGKNDQRIVFEEASLATTFLNMEQYDQAIRYYKKELVDYKGPKEEKYFAVDYGRLAFCLTRTGRLEEARSFLDSAAGVLKRYPPSHPWIKYYYFMGYWHQAKGNTSAALRYYDSALSVSRKIHELYSSVNVLYGKYDIYYGQKKYHAARAVAYRIRDITTIEHDTVVYDLIALYKTLGQIEKAVGNTKAALSWTEKYSALSDSAHTREVETKINRIAAQYEAEKKEKMILQLQNEFHKQHFTIEKSRLITYLLLAALIIVALLLITFIIVAKNRKRSARQTDMVHRQQLLRQENEKQLLVANAVVDGQEKERARLSADLHDGLGGVLTGIKLELQHLEDQHEANGRMAPIIRRVSGAVKELRRIAHNMMPENLLRFGLEAALQDICSNMKTATTNISFYASDISPGILQQEQIMIYRIVQELISNALKYAAASEIFVQCMQREASFSITVEDNGRGFDIGSLHDRGGMGLFNVKNRVSYLKGSMDIGSVAGEGTTINITIILTTDE